MIVTDEKHNSFGHYRLDRIKDIEILEEKAEPLKNPQDAYEYARNKLFMYAGETGTVTFRCKDTILDQMIDIFGKDMAIISEDEEHFLIHVKTTDQGAIFLAQQFLDSITIIKPDELRDKFKETLNDAKERYSG